MYLTIQKSGFIPARSVAVLIATALSLLARRPSHAQAVTPSVPTTQQLEVTGQPVASPTPSDETRLKLDHIMKELSGTEITVTKKATVIKLDEQPTVIANNQQ